MIPVGDGRTTEKPTPLDNISAEAEYQNLGRMVAPNPTRNATQETSFTELGRNATARWNALTAAGFTGTNGTFESPVATSPA